MEDKKKSILLLDDDENIAELVSDALKLQGFRVVVATDGLDGERKLKNEKFQLIITDINMPKVNGIEFLKRAKDMILGPMLPTIVISGSMEDFKPRLALMENITFLEKPFDIKSLSEKVDEMLKPQKSNPGKKIVLKANEILIREGEEGQSMFWVIDGTLKIIKETDGKTIELGIAEKGELVGEMSFLDEKPRSATVVAEVDCELLEIPNGKFSQVLEAQPGWFRGLVRILSERLRTTNEKVDI